MNIIVRIKNPVNFLFVKNWHIHRPLSRPFVTVVFLPLFQRRSADPIEFNLLILLAGKLHTYLCTHVLYKHHGTLGEFQAEKPNGRPVGRRIKWWQMKFFVRSLVAEESRNDNGWKVGNMETCSPRVIPLGDETVRMRGS